MRKPTPGKTLGGPINQSRAAGQAATPSVAATSPLEGSFYSPGDEPALAQIPPSAAFRTQFTEETRTGSLPIEQGGTVDREVGERMVSDDSSEGEDVHAEIARIRSIRKPIGGFAQKLALPKRTDYHRHWFNDVAGRIEEAEANGWKHVKDQNGKPICRCVGTGRDKGAMYAYAMEIPEVFWLEDQAARHEAAQGKMDALKASPFRSKPGEAKAADAGKFYDPTESTSGPLSIVKG